MSKSEMAVLWVALYFSALVGFAARLGYLLYGISEQPPEDPAQLRAWHRKRRWLIISEFTALPLFATATLVGALEWDWSLPFAIGVAMGAGALGFGFLLHAFQTIVTRRIERA